MSSFSHVLTSGMPLNNYKGVDSAITQRPTATALLAIDSEDRYKNWLDYSSATEASNKNPYDFTIEKNESLMNGFFTRLGLTEINFPWVVPNVNARTKDIIFNYFTIPFGPVSTNTISLSSGFRTPAQLASDLQVAIRAINPALNSFTVTYGIFTNGTASTLGQVPVFEFRSNTNIAFFFERMPYNSSVYPYDVQNKQLFDLLGLRGDFTDVLSASNYQRSGATFCQAIRYIDIVCSQLVNNQALKDTMSQTVARDSLCRLYIESPSTPSNVPCNSATFCPVGCAPFQLYKDFNTPKQINWLPNQPIAGSLRFQVYDDNGILLSEAFSKVPSDPLVEEDSITILNKVDWSMTLLVSEN